MGFLKVVILTAIGKAVSKNNFFIMRKKKLELELSEVVYSDEKININKLDNTIIFEIGKEATTDIGEAVALMMRTLDNNHSIWNLEIISESNEISPEKTLYWLTGGHFEWKNLENFNQPWADSYLYFQEEFGISIVNIIKKSKKLKDIKEGFLKNLNLPVLYDFAISKNLIR